MSALRFAKMSGAGNDFIVFDNRAGVLDGVRPEWIRKLCTRGMAVGADGLMLLNPSADADFGMRYFNADGREASMCGNGARCLTRFAVVVGAGREGEWLRFTTPAGLYAAKAEAGQVTLRLPPPARFEQDIRLPLAGGERTADFTDTGVPHAVIFSPDVRAEAVAAVGREIRFHARFQPAGANVNFCQVLGRHELAVRTYERGVEGETLACGTGVAAAALLACRRGLVESPVAVKTASGVTLEMTFSRINGGFSEVCQRGEARLVFWGELSPEADAFEDIHSGK